MIWFYFKALLWESIILLLSPATPTLVQYYCTTITQYTPSPGLMLGLTRATGLTLGSTIPLTLHQGEVLVQSPLDVRLYELSGVRVKIKG